MSNKENRASDVDIDALLAELDEVSHNTSSLQQSIIEKTALLPQQARRTQNSVVLGGSFLRRFLMAAGCVALVGVGYSVFFPVTPEVLLGAEQPSLQELEYQELMMMEDEILFAQL